MRSSSVYSFVRSARTTAAATTLAILLTTAAGAAPATNKTRGEYRERARREDPIERVIKIVKRFLGVTTQGDITLPHPTT